LTRARVGSPDTKDVESFGGKCAWMAAAGNQAEAVDPARKQTAQERIGASRVADLRDGALQVV